MATSKTSTVANDGWNDVEDEAMIVFDTPGDEFIGMFTGWTTSEGEKQIPQAHFKNNDGEFFVNCGADLKRKLRKVQKGTETRIVYDSDLDTGQASPMRVYRVQTRTAR